MGVIHRYYGSKIRGDDRMRFIDAFAGIGGFRMGLEHFGHTCVKSIEYDSKAQVAYKALWGDEGLWEGDIRNLDYRDLPDFDVLAGGFPCAKFSMAGDRLGFKSEDPRAQMFFELAKIAQAKKPKYLLFENVKGLLNHDEGRSFKVILETLDELGYDVEWQVINAKHYGYPVIRERLFIIGHLRGESTEKVFPISKAIRPHEESPRIYQYRRGYFRRFKGYCPTLTASMGTGGNNVPFIITNKGLRKLTPKELFRLQGVDEQKIALLLDSGLPDSALYERAGRTVFIPIVKDIVRRMK